MHQKGIDAYVKYSLFDKEHKTKKTYKTSKNTTIKRPLTEHKKRAVALLLSERGIYHRKKRYVDVEPVFGMLKENKGFRRFKLSGLNKVSIEFGLLALAHNFSKLAKILLLKDFLCFCYNLFFIPKHQIAFFRISS
jgi:hypothetical protein